MGSVVGFPTYASTPNGYVDVATGAPAPASLVPQLSQQFAGTVASLGAGYSRGIAPGTSQQMGGRATVTSSGGVGAGGGTASGSSSTPGVIPQMQSNYEQLLNINQQRYGNMQSAYNAGQSNLSEKLPGIYQGYGDIQKNVMNTLGMGQVLGQNGNWGVAGPAAQAIGQQGAAQQGQVTQRMTDAGLGNTSVPGNLSNQANLFTQQAYGGLGAQLAQTAAGYQSQIGLAGQGAQMQGLGMQTGLTQAALGPMEMQAANTAGNLTGQTSSSYSNFPPQSYGGGGGYGGQNSGYNAAIPTPWQPANSPQGAMAGAIPQVGGHAGGGGGGGGLGSYTGGSWGVPAANPFGEGTQPMAGQAEWQDFGGVPGEANNYNGLPMGMSGNSGSYWQGGSGLYDSIGAPNTGAGSGINPESPDFGDPFAPPGDLLAAYGGGDYGGYA